MSSIDSLLGRKTKIFILCYHSVSSDGWEHGVSLTALDKQFGYLHKEYNFISLSQLIDYLDSGVEIPDYSVVITFDDGYKDIFGARALIKKYGIVPTVFLLSDPVNVNRTEVANKKDNLSDAEIRVLMNDGWEIGNHSATHPDFHSLSVSDAKIEIIDSKATLQKKFGVEINSFAYPKGRYTKVVLDAMMHAKYKLGLSMDDGVISKKSPRYTIPRVGIMRNHSFLEFKASFSPTVIQLRKFIKSLKK